jgi:hypothetical protein
MSSVEAQPHPEVSVVVASIVGAPFIDGCLASLEEQARALGAEVVVVACGAVAEAERLRQRYPWARVLHEPERLTVPMLRRLGVEAARGELVAIIEEHCTAAPDWLAAGRAAHRGASVAAVGGPVADSDYRGLVDWVVYFIEYGSALPPAPAGKVSQLNTANIVYRRQVLLDHRPLLDEGYWEATLHPRLVAEGAELLSVPSMVVRHAGPFRLGYYLQQRYWFSRAYAGARRSGLSPVHRLLYLATAPVLPLLFLARIGQQVRRKRYRVDRFQRAAPLILVALVAMVAGEWVGYLLGPGDALSKVE